MLRCAILSTPCFQAEHKPLSDTLTQHTVLGGDSLTDSEKLDFLITEIIGMKTDIQGMKSEIQGMKADIQGIKAEIQGMQSEIKSMNTHMDNHEFQLKSTERILRNQIMKSESLILGEVERVHLILDQHLHNQAMHTVLA